MHELGIKKLQLFLHGKKNILIKPASLPILARQHGVSKVFL